MRRRSWWGWGWEDEGLAPAEVTDLGQRLAGLGAPPAGMLPAPEVPELSASRLATPGSLAHLATAEERDRAGHAMGKAYRDVMRALRGLVPRPPDLVVRPASEDDVVAVLDWCSAGGIAVVPYGGGSSVVGGVECPDGPSISLDLGRLDRVLDVDTTSLAARIQAGTLGPALEAQLRPHDLTLRHYPQSFEFSTLGGWIATRSAGHYATGPTHIEDHVESLRLVSPAGVVATRRLPASGAGPAADRLVAGSEGTLGVITEAWMRVRRRPEHRAAATVRFADRVSALAALRDIAQSGLEPANCRLLDAGEAALFAGRADGAHLLLLGFESAAMPVGELLVAATRMAVGHGGEQLAGGSGDGWRAAFLRAPYARDAMARLGMIVETFETATTWDRLDELHAEVAGAVLGALQRVPGGGVVTSRITHVYPDGAAPYYTVVAPGRPGEEVAMWDEVKAVASAAIGAAGGTITHHHAVGRDHRRWFVEEASPPWLAALAAAKTALDPMGVMNPGALLPA